MSDEMLVVLKLVLIIAIGLALYVIARRGVHSLNRLNLVSIQAATVYTGIIKWVLIISAILLGLNTVGISVTSLWASLSAILMLMAIGFVAVWSILSNISSALILVFSSPYRIGDEVEILEPSVQDPDKPALRGRISDISFFYTTLEQTADDHGKQTVHVPNNIFLQKAIRLHRGNNTTSLRKALFAHSRDEKTEEKDQT